jgi:hypothetical protein
MPKADGTFNPADYAPVADRITSFYDRYPTGRIVTKLLSRIDRGGGAYEVTFRAQVFRAAEDVHAAATGYASEREDDGDINAVACVENTETSAIGRALANLGFTASRQRPSAEEMAKADRARARLSRGGATATSSALEPAAAVPRMTRPLGARPTLSAQSGFTRTVSERSAAIQAHADRVSDLLDLLRSARRAGLRDYRADVIRTKLIDGNEKRQVLDRLSRRLRRWVAERTALDLSAHVTEPRGPGVSSV